MDIDYQQLKAGGIIRQKQKDLFSIRLKVPVGNLTSTQLRAIATIAEKFGCGTVHLTMRQGIEIPSVNIGNIDKVIESLKETNITVGACGARVRVITACQGNSLCLHGLGNTQDLALKLDERYYGKSGLPHKFKIGVTGCPNSCIKPQENDVGFMAVAEPVLDESDGNYCTGCGLCVSICPSGAITLESTLKTKLNQRPENDKSDSCKLEAVGGNSKREDNRDEKINFEKEALNQEESNKPIINLKKCYKDAKCVFSCPSNALKIGRFGWNVFIGGKWGKEPQLGVKILEFLPTDEVVLVVDKILTAYINLAEKGERLGKLINRIGIDKFCELMEKCYGNKCSA